MSCCGGKCGCGPNCKCGSGCNGCGMYPDLGESSNSATLIFGVSSQKSYFEGSEMMGAEGGGCGNGSCSCGDSCTCGSDCKCGK
ncbi:hypothetical protein MKW94_006654 [Papaver nudicaule]|uniref:Metallothionein-like protein n=1 Tax=Papaver nudicaule TaxID=74823 RepID=A0AA41W3A0_PAPNU|nr:hypothetical protein [Papaver nudicaule]